MTVSAAAVSPALAGDFSLSGNRTLTIAAGSTSSSGTVTITANNNTVDAPNKAVTVSGSASASVTAPSDVTLTITDDEAAPAVTLVLTPASIAENGGVSTVTATLSHASSAATTVTVSAAAEAPALAADFTLGGSALSIAAGATTSAGTVTITANNNDVDAPHKSVTVSAAASNSQGVTDPSNQTLTITDDELASTTVTLTVAPTQVAEDGGAKTLTVTGMLDAGTRTTATVVTLAVNAGTATATDDYTATGATLTIVAKQANATATLSLTPVDDAVAEGPETVSIAGTVAGLTVTPAAVTIIDDEGTPTVTLALSNASISENGGVSTVTATLSHASSAATTVTVSAAAVSPALAGDFSLSGNRTLTIAAGSTSSSGTVTITAVNNGVDAPNKEVTVSAVASNSQGVTDPSNQTLTITDDEETLTVTLALSSASISEDSGVSTVTATLSNASSEATTVTVSVSQVSPASSSDYNLSVNTVLSIAAGATTSSGTVTVTGVDNDVDAANKTVTVKGSADNNVGVTGPSDVSLTLEDDDARGVTVSEAELDINEGGTGTYTVVLDSQPTGPVTVTPARSSGDSDVTVSAALSFTADNWNTPQTVTVSAGQDTDGLNDTAVIGHTVSGADYGSVIAATVAVTVDDDETGFSVSSPDGSLLVGVTSNAGGLSYLVRRNGAELIADSPFSIKNSVAHTVTGSSNSSHDSTWTPTWGQFSSIRDHHNRLTLDLSVGGIVYALIFQVYDDGLGFRFSADEQPSLTGTTVDFNVRYNMKSGYQGHWPNNEHSPEGPHPVQALPSGTGDKPPTTPLLVNAGTDGFFALLESDLYPAENFESHILFQRVTGEPAVESNMESETIASGSDFITPWRVVLVGDTPGDLLESTVTVNLASPLELADASWIKPGKGLFNWRTLGYQAADGFTYRVNTDSVKRLIDFVAEEGLDYVQVDDEWWRNITDGQIVSQANNFDINTVMSHAASKNVDMVVFIDRDPPRPVRIHNTTDEELYVLIDSLGAKGVKYDYRKSDVPFTRHALRSTAQKEMVISFHALPVPLTGARRTIPNAITRQNGWGQQDGRKAFAPTDYVEMAMINALLGPFDMINGIYDINEMPSRTKGANNPINSTVASENARVLIMFSGLVMLPDTPEEYRKKPEMFEFLKEMPATWDETRVLHSSLPNYISTARRSGSEWFVCSVTNETARTLSIPLDFLDSGNYQVTYYEDDHDGATPTHYINNRETYQVRTGTVTSADTVSAIMVAGGGHCMWIRRNTATLALSSTSISENSGVSTVTATLSHASSAATTVTVSAAPVAPAVAGATTSTGAVTITAVNNGVDAPDKAVTVKGAVSNNPDVFKPTDLSLTITDDDTRGVTVSKTTLDINEGGTGTYTVVLNSEPTGTVTVTPARDSGDSDVTVSAALDFTADNWDTEQTVTVTGGQDTDAVGDTAVIDHTVSGADFGSLISETGATVTVTVDDDETISTGVTLLVSPSSLSEGEGATTVTVRAALNSGTRNTATTVTVTVGSGTAMEGTDFNAVTGFTITIAANQISGSGTFILTPINDTDFSEPDETVDITGSAPGSLTVTPTMMLIIESRGVIGAGVAEVADDCGAGAVE